MMTIRSGTKKSNFLRFFLRSIAIRATFPLPANCNKSYDTRKSSFLQVFYRRSPDALHAHFSEYWKKSVVAMRRKTESQYGQ